MRSYASKTELLTTGGDHLRYVPGPMAKSLVDGGGAEIAHANGKVRSVRLVASAATHAQMIGPPTGGWLAPRFTRREMLDDSGTRIWAHHPRCCDYE